MLATHTAPAPNNWPPNYCHWKRSKEVETHWRHSKGVFKKVFDILCGKMAYFIFQKLTPWYFIFQKINTPISHISKNKYPYISYFKKPLQGLLDTSIESTLNYDWIWKWNQRQYQHWINIRFQRGIHVRLQCRINSGIWCWLNVRYQCGIHV